ncbi:MAG: AAA family ATPase [Sulfobacillus sp.]
MFGLQAQPGLTEGQERCFEVIKEFLCSRTDPSDLSSYAMCLAGCAGSGKTYLMKEVVRYARSVLRYRICGVAPTHKARKVLERGMSGAGLGPVPGQQAPNFGAGLRTAAPAITVACLLQKLKSPTYVGTHRYVSQSSRKMFNYDLFIVDEVSMVSDDDFERIVSFLRTGGHKAIFVGDPNQIPNPSQKMERRSGFLVKKDSRAFSLPRKVQLTGCVRQRRENPITDFTSKLVDYLHDSVEDMTLNDPEVPNDSRLNSQGQGIQVITDYLEFGEMICEEFRKSREELSGASGSAAALPSARVIAYTNETVRSFNLLVRRSLGFAQPFVVGELLTGYANLGFPERLIENGQDYLVMQVVQTGEHVVAVPDAVFRELSGFLLTLSATDTKTEHELFFPDLYHESNAEFLQELVFRAEKANMNLSTKADFRRYCQLKEKVIITEVLYVFQGQIYPEAEMRETHPLLTTATYEVLQETDAGVRSRVPSALSDAIDGCYPRLIQQRMSDDKPMSECERLVDRFMVIDRDLFYGYAITAHKAQGSTYDRAYIDESDFSKIKNRWNHRMKCTEMRLREKNQLRYVAWSRPKERVIVYLPESRERGNVSRKERLPEEVECRDQRFCQGSMEMPDLS